MKTVTDLGEIKKLARMFVHLDIQSTEYSPLIVKHPFTDSGMIAYRTDDGGIAQADITSDPAALKLWQEEKLRQIKEARTPHEISFMITKSYSLAFLKYAAPHLSSKDLSEMLADVWVRTESPNNDPNMSKNRLLSLFKKAQPQFLMDEEEYEAFQKLDDTMTRKTVASSTTPIPMTAASTVTTTANTASSITPPKTPVRLPMKNKKERKTA